MAPTVRILAAPLAAGVPLPALCPRHGQPAVATRRVTFTSRTPPWVVVLILLSLLVALVVALVLTKRVTAPAVPVCDRCVEDRRTRLLLMTAGLVAAPVLIVVGVSLSSGSGVVALLLGLVVAPLAALVAGTQARWGTLMRGLVDDTGVWVTLSKPAPAFADAFAVLAGR